MNHIPTKRWITVPGLVIALVTGSILLTCQSVVEAASSCAAPATNYGTDTMKVTTPSAASYTIWTHMKIPSTSANSVLLNVDGTCYKVGASTAIPTGTWRWIDYYGGNRAAIVKQSLGQGSQSVKLVGTASGVLVDRLEFISSSCTPTGNGSNCASVTTTTAPTSSGTSTSVVTPTNTNVPTQVTAPVTVQPNTTSSNGTILEVQYYLNNKLLATVTTSPFSYTLNTKKILNGTYTFETKTTYDSGKVTTATQQLVIKNPASFEQLMLAAEHYIVPEVIILIILIIGFVVIRKHLNSRRGPTDPDMILTTPTNTGGTPGVLTPYENSPYSTGTPSYPPQQQTPPTQLYPPQQTPPAQPYQNTPSYPPQQQTPPTQPTDNLPNNYR